MLQPQNLIKNIQVLCFWCSEQTCRSAVLDHDEFDISTLAQAKVVMKRREEDKTETPQIKPDKLKPKNWKIWDKQFDLYQFNHKVAQFFSLDYVIRPDITVGHTYTTIREADLYRFPLTGPHYREENMQVFCMLSDLIYGIEGGSQINDYTRAKNCRSAQLALKTYREGGGNERKKIIEAEAVLEMLHYKNVGLL